ncbi:PREDICTED: ancient ubiquitous protein 1-like [Ceratosolen solmsi marchali]|uniref:Lipid droplet-regulating VLDL assembly factor AUP1 n=1 Tax=Ceratosolen solmsi marchali TaxID=326594 RepID=A0AAJ6YCS5_9HYME|nr:PREDICTED: ancient ubiquitous protein 1-like [Ceratosolen solmsi marchali]
MSQIDINELFDESRFPSGWRLFSVLLYLPIGLILVLFRLIVCLLLWLIAAILPDSQALRLFLNRGHAFAFGVIVKVSPDGEQKDEQIHVVIANSISILDYFVLSTAAKTMTPSLLNLPDSLSNALGIQKMNMNNKDVLVAEIKRFISNSKTSIALQPELDTTNSRKALLKFNTWPFCIEPAVQPVVLQAWRPEFVDIQLTSIASIWWMDIICFMFVPYTIFTVKFLKVKRNTDAHVLVREVEKDIAQNLKIETSLHTISDKAEYIKRHIMEEVRNQNQQNSIISDSQIVPSMEILRMVRQVSEVLPLVPHNVILKDLLKTRNVDVTITNILDGIVTYTPETVSTTIAPSSSTNKRYASTMKLNSNNSTVGLTFKEKKAKMISEARERYIEKHFLKDC